MNEISKFRLYLLRAAYALIVLGLAVMIWSGIIFPSENVPHMNQVVRSMLGGVSLLAILGIFYPLRMLPLLFFELIWKSIWILAFGLRLKMDADMQQTLYDCIFGVVLVLLVTPWDYVFKHYLKPNGEQWRGRAVTGSDS